MQRDVAAAMQTPKQDTTEDRRSAPPFLPTASMDKRHVPARESSVMVYSSQCKLSPVPGLLDSVDLSHVPDNEFFLLPPNAAPPVLEAFAPSTSHPDDEYDAMEVEAITSSSQNQTSDAVTTGHEETRSRSVTFDEGSPSSLTSSLFRVPNLSLKPRSCGSASRGAVPWETHTSTW